MRTISLYTVTYTTYDIYDTLPVPHQDSYHHMTKYYVLFINRRTFVCNMLIFFLLVRGFSDVIHFAWSSDVLPEPVTVVGAQAFASYIPMLDVQYSSPQTVRCSEMSMSISSFGTPCSGTYTQIYSSTYTRLFSDCLANFVFHPSGSSSCSNLLLLNADRLET